MASRRFGPYEVLVRLATGGAANIFLARRPDDTGVGRLCVLKTLLPERASDQEFVDMFLDEARLAARLQHPSCVEIYDLGKEGGTFYISMEYIVGETVWGLLASVPETRQPLPALVVASIIASACEGLHHAHELNDPDGRPYNLVHRDVSPQNIMVSYEGQTKVLDFGIAKAETGRAATATGIVKGKFSYMSPEQITGGTVDRRSDIYSLGIVLFECLAARRLYRADTPEEIARLMLERRPPRLRELVPDVDPVLDAICAKALSRHPNNRYQTAREMAEALRELMHHQGFVDGPVPVRKLVEERFGARIIERRKVIERAASGAADDIELVRVLNARPVMDVDLFAGDDGLPEPRPGSMIDAATPSEDAPPGLRTGGSMMGRGVRVELHSTGTPPESIELSDRAQRLNADDEGSATRLDGDSTVLEGLENVELSTHVRDAAAEGGGTGEIDTRRFEVDDTLSALDDVPVAQPRKKDGVRSDPRAPTRALASARKVVAGTEPKVETLRPPAKAPAARAEDPPARPVPDARFGSAEMTAPSVHGNTDALGSPLVHEPPRLVEEQSASNPLVPFAVPDLSLTPEAGLPARHAPSVVASPPRAGESALLAPMAREAPADSAVGRAVPPMSMVAPASVEPLSGTGYTGDVAEPQTYSLGVVLAALAFGVTLGLLLGVLISLLTRP